MLKDTEILDGRCSLSRKFAYIWDILSSFQIKVLVFSWTYFAFQPFLFLFQLLYFSVNKMRSYLVLIYPFQGTLTFSVRGISGSIHTFPFSKESSSHSQSKILPVAMAGKGQLYSWFSLFFFAYLYLRQLITNYRYLRKLLASNFCRSMWEKSQHFLVCGFRGKNFFCACFFYKPEQ